MVRTSPGTEERKVYRFKHDLDVDSVTISPSWFNSLPENDPSVVFLGGVKVVVLRRWMPSGEFETIYLRKREETGTLFLVLPNTDIGKKAIQDSVTHLIKTQRNKYKRVDELTNGNDPRRINILDIFDTFDHQAIVDGAATISGTQYRIEGNQIYSDAPSYEHAQQIPFSLADYTIHVGITPTQPSVNPAWYRAFSTTPNPLQFIWRLKLDRDSINSKADRRIYNSTLDISGATISHVIVMEGERQKVIINNAATLDLLPGQGALAGYWYARDNNNNVYIFDKEFRYTWLYKMQLDEVEPIIQTHSPLHGITEGFDKITPEFLQNIFNNYPNHPDLRYMNGQPFLFMQNYDKVKGSWTHLIALVGYNVLKNKIEVYWLDYDGAARNGILGRQSSKFNDHSDAWIRLLHNQPLTIGDQSLILGADNPVTDIKQIFYHGYFDENGSTITKSSFASTRTDDPNDIPVSIDGLGLKITYNAKEIPMRAPSMFSIGVPWFKNGRVGVDDGFVNLTIKAGRKTTTQKAAIFTSRELDDTYMIVLLRENELVYFRGIKDTDGANFNNIKKAFEDGKAEITITLNDSRGSSPAVITKNGLPQNIVLEDSSLAIDINGQLLIVKAKITDQELSYTFNPVPFNVPEQFNPADLASALPVTVQAISQATTHSPLTEITPGNLKALFAERPRHPDVRILEDKPYLLLRQVGNYLTPSDQTTSPFFALVTLNDNDEVTVFMNNEIQETKSQGNSYPEGIAKKIERDNQTIKTIIENEAVNRVASNALLKKGLQKITFKKNGNVNIENSTEDLKSKKFSIDGVQFKVEGMATLMPPSLQPINTQWFRRGVVGRDAGFINIKNPNGAIIKVAVFISPKKFYFLFEKEEELYLFQLPFNPPQQFIRRDILDKIRSSILDKVKRTFEADSDFTNAPSTLHIKLTEKGILRNDNDLVDVVQIQGRAISVKDEGGEWDKGIVGGEAPHFINEKSIPQEGIQNLPMVKLERNFDEASGLVGYQIYINSEYGVGLAFRMAEDNQTILGVSYFLLPKDGQYNIKNILINKIVPEASLESPDDSVRFGSGDNYDLYPKVRKGLLAIHFARDGNVLLSTTDSPTLNAEVTSRIKGRELLFNHAHLAEQISRYSVELGAFSSDEYEMVNSMVHEGVEYTIHIPLSDIRKSWLKVQDKAYLMLFGQLEEITNSFGTFGVIPMWAVVGSKLVGCYLIVNRGRKAITEFSEFLVANISEPDVASLAYYRHILESQLKSLNDWNPAKAEISMGPIDGYYNSWQVLTTQPMEIATRWGFKNRNELISGLINNKNKNGYVVWFKFGESGTEHPYRVTYKNGDKDGVFLVPDTSQGAPEGVFEVVKKGSDFVLVPQENSALDALIRYAQGSNIRPQYNFENNIGTFSMQIIGDRVANDGKGGFENSVAPSGEYNRKIVNGQWVDWEYIFTFNSQDVESIKAVLDELGSFVTKWNRYRRELDNPLGTWIADKPITPETELKNISGLNTPHKKLKISGIERLKDGQKEFEITEVSVRGNSSVRLDLPVTVFASQNIRVVVQHANYWEEVIFYLTDKGSIKIESQKKIALSEQQKVTVKHSDAEYKVLNFTINRQVNDEVGDITYSVGAPLAAPVPVGEVFYIPATTNNYFARAAFQLNAQGKVEWLKDQTEFLPLNITTTIDLPIYDNASGGVAELTWKRAFNDDGSVKSHAFVSGKLRGVDATAELNGEEITLTVDTDTYTEKLHLLVDVNDPTQSIVNESQSRFTQKAISKNYVLTTSLKNIVGANNELKVEVEEVKNGADITRTIKSVWVRGQICHPRESGDPGSFLVQADTETHWEDIEFKINESGALEIINNDVWLNKPQTQKINLTPLHDTEGRTYPDIFEAQIDIVQNPRINPGQLTSVIPAGGIHLSFVGADPARAGLEPAPTVNLQPITVGAGSPRSLEVELQHPQLGNITVNLKLDAEGNITSVTRMFKKGGVTPPLPIEIILNENDTKDSRQSKLIIRFGNYSKEIGLFSYFGQGFKRGVQFQTGRYLINTKDISADDLSWLMKLIGQPYFFSKEKPFEHAYLEVDIHSQYDAEGRLAHTFGGIRGLAKNNILKETLLTGQTSTFPTPGITLGDAEARAIEKALDPDGSTAAAGIDSVHIESSNAVDMMSELNIHPAEWLKPTYATIDKILDYLDGKQKNLPERLEFMANDGRVFSFAVKPREDRRTGFFDIMVDQDHPIETWVEGRKNESIQIIAQGPRVYNRGGRPLLFELKNEAGGETQGKKAYELHMRPYRHSYTDIKGITHSLLPYFPYLINAMDHTGSNDNAAEIVDEANKRMAAYLYAYLNHKRDTPVPMPKVEYITQRTVKKDGEAISITFGNTGRTGEKYEVYTLEGFQYYKEARYLKFAPRLKLKVQEFTPTGSLIRTTEHEIEHSPSRATKGAILLQSTTDSSVKFIWDHKRKTLMKVSDFNAALSVTSDQQQILQDKINATRKHLYQQVEFRPGGGVRPVGVREAAFGDIEHMDKISVLPPEVLSFEEPTNIQKLETPDAIQQLFDALTAKGIDLDAETLLPDEGSILAMSMVGRDEEEFTFVGENFILKIPFVEESMASNGDKILSRYLADIATNPVEGLQGARILIKNPNFTVTPAEAGAQVGVSENPEYFEISLAALLSKRSGGITRENIEVDIPLPGDAKKHFTLVQFGNRASYTGRDVFGYQLRLDGAKAIEGTPTADLKAFQDQLPISRSPDYSSSILVNHGKNFQLKDSDGNVAFTLPLEMIELTHLGRPTYMMAGIVENEDGSFTLPYEKGEHMGSPLPGKFTVYRLPQAERSVLYLQDQQNNWYTLMIGSRGEIWMWESNRDLREYQRPVKAFGFLNTGIKQAYKTDKQAYATRVLSQGVSTITAVLSQSDDASRASVTTGDKPRVSFEVRYDEAGWHATLAPSPQSQAPSEKWPFTSENSQIEIVEDSWLDANKTRQFGKVRVIVKGEIKDESGTVVLRPYATLIFKNRDALLNQQSPLAIDYVHYHKTHQFIDKKLMSDDDGFVSERAGIPFDENVTVDWDDIFLTHDADSSILEGLKTALSENTGHAAMAPLLGALQVLSVTQGRASGSPLPWGMTQNTDGSWNYNDAIVASLETYVRGEILKSSSGSSSSGGGNVNKAPAVIRRPAPQSGPKVQTQSTIASTPVALANSKSKGGAIIVDESIVAAPVVDIVADKLVADTDKDDTVGASFVAPSSVMGLNGASTNTIIAGMAAFMPATGPLAMLGPFTAVR